MLKTGVGKTMTWLLLAAAIAIIGLLGVYYWDTMQELDNTSLPSWVPVRHATPTPTVTPATTGTTTIDATTGWKTGTFKKITFKYPPNWSYRGETELAPDSAELTTDISKTDSNNQKFTLTIVFDKITTSNTSLEKAITAYASMGETIKLSNKQVKNIDSQNGLRYDASCCGGKYDSVFILYNNSLYRISARVGGMLTQDDLVSFKPTFNTFLSKIKFTK